MTVSCTLINYELVQVLMRVFSRLAGSIKATSHQLSRNPSSRLAGARALRKLS